MVYKYVCEGIKGVVALLPVFLSGERMEEGTGEQAGRQAGGKGAGETGTGGTGAEGSGTNVSSPRTLGRLVQNLMELSSILPISSV